MVPPLPPTDVGAASIAKHRAAIMQARTPAAAMEAFRRAARDPRVGESDRAALKLAAERKAATLRSHGKFRLV